MEFDLCLFLSVQLLVEAQLFFRQDVIAAW